MLKQLMTVLIILAILLIAFYVLSSMLVGFGGPRLVIGTIP